MTEFQSVAPKPACRWHQFSLLALLIILTILACGWLAAPTVRANRFVSAVKSGNFQRAESMFGKPDEAFPSHYASKAQVRLCKIEVAPITLGQVWRGERFIWVHVPRGPKMYDFDCDFTFCATRRDVSLWFYIH